MLSHLLCVLVSIHHFSLACMTCFTLQKMKGRVVTTTWLAGLAEIPAFLGKTPKIKFTITWLAGIWLTGLRFFHVIVFTGTARLPESTRRKRILRSSCALMLSSFLVTMAARATKFQWTNTMVDNLFSSLLQFKSNMEYCNVGFNIDKVKQYEAVREAMAQMYSSIKQCSRQS